MAIVVSTSPHDLIFIPTSKGLAIVSSSTSNFNSIDLKQFSMQFSIQSKKKEHLHTPPNPTWITHTISCVKNLFPYPLSPSALPSSNPSVSVLDGCHREHRVNQNHGTHHFSQTGLEFFCRNHPRQVDIMEQERI